MTTWSVHTGDALEWLRSLPDDSADLVFTSPPYLEARTYGIGAGKKIDVWVPWMVEIVSECCRVCKGLVAVVCDGQTRKYRYLPAPFLLAADLHRKGFNLRRPAYYHRIGIPGSGGPDWLRGDVEPIVCVTRPGRLPWSNNTACGHPPKWAPGGAMSHRISDGTRKNQWGSSASGKSTRSRDRHGVKSPPMPRPSHQTVTKRQVQTIPRPGQHSQESTYYSEPVLANPGNLIRCNVGGGQMGSRFAHENEAPFPLKLAEFFVKSYCPPGGVVCDPFAGSGTVAHAAVEQGRRFVGCDIRPSQTSLIERRMSGVVPSFC